MRKIFESVITVTVAVLGLTLSIIWYQAEYEIEPLIGIITCAGVLVTNIVYRFFSEEAPTPTNKNMIIDSEVKATNIIVGDNNDIKIQHILGNLEDYQNLEQALEEDRKLLSISNNLEVQEIISTRINKNEEKRESIKKAIEGAFEYISKLTISTERLDQAKALFLEGDIPGALEILKDEAIQADYLVLQKAQKSEEERHHRKMEEIAEKTKGIAEEWKMKAVLMATRYEDGDWFEKTKGYYEKALEVDRDVEHVFEYAVFLHDHNQLKEATPLYEEALQTYRTLAPANPEVLIPIVAGILNNLANLHRAENKLGQAQFEYEAALQIYQDLAKSSSPAFWVNVAGILNNLGILHNTKNELEQAQARYNEAMRLYQLLPQVNSDAFRSIIAVTLNNLGLLHHYKNEVDQAQDKFEKALTIIRSLADNNPKTFLSEVAGTLNNLANLHSTQKQLDKAQDEYKEALQINRDLAKNNPRAFLPDVALTLSNLANLHSTQKELELAQGEYEEALQIYRSLAKSNLQAFLPYVANTASNMALFYQDCKPDQEKSLKLAKEALNIAKPFGGYLKGAQESIIRAISVIRKWGFDADEFSKEMEHNKM